MKKALYFLTCIAVIAALSTEGLAGRDVAILEPVQTVQLSSDGRKIVLQTDTGARGSGKSLDDALRALRESASAFVFLDTADYLLIAPELLPLLPSLWEILRPSCTICLMEGQPDLEQAAAFLEVHKPEIALKDYMAGMTELPVLKTEGNEMKLVS